MLEGREWRLLVEECGKVKVCLGFLLLLLLSFVAGRFLLSGGLGVWLGRGLAFTAVVLCSLLLLRLRVATGWASVSAAASRHCCCRSPASACGFASVLSERNACC